MERLVISFSDISIRMRAMNYEHDFEQRCNESFIYKIAINIYRWSSITSLQLSPVPLYFGDFSNNISDIQGSLVTPGFVIFTRDVSL